MKKTWNTPQLVLLVRAKPEETLLLSCKTGTPGAGLATPSDGAPNDSNLGCFTQYVGPAPTATLCSQCDSLSKS